MKKFRVKESLAYHSEGRPGKIEVNTSKPCTTQLDLSLAYTPGVAVPCLEIAKDPSKAHDYTIRGNLVAVITNGSAVLGLGNIGPLASKPVMEGKGVLFKRFADIDVFDLELDTSDPDEFIRTVKILEPTFGGINLEDIKAPECFYIEKELRKQLDIPVFHDDQHGTAIIVGAAFLNAVSLAGKEMNEVRVVFSGAGAAAIAVANLLVDLGVSRANITMTDIAGVVYEGREECMDPFKGEFAQKTEARTLADVIGGADAFIGLSVKGVMSKEMAASMASDPIIFALANPDPEISPEDVHEVRQDAIMATGRSDYPNQVNNVLGFPFIFRGALDVQARAINEEMKIAATHALAELAREDVPEDVLNAYSDKALAFGRNYIIPKPFDTRALYRVAPAVAKAAMDSGVARKPIQDFRKYAEQLERHLHPSREAIHQFVTRARAGKKMRIVYPQGEHETILQACDMIIRAQIAHPILLGDVDKIFSRMEELELRFPKGTFTIIDPSKNTPCFRSYAESYRKSRERNGSSLEQAEQQVREPIDFALMMVKEGDADGCISGINKVYSETIRPALQTIGLKEGVTRACGMYIMLDKRGKTRFFADTTLHTNPTAEELAEIAIGVADMVQTFGIIPRVAMLSFSNFGSAQLADSLKVKKATEIAQALRPDLMLEGELRVSVAVNPLKHLEDFPFCKLRKEANVFIFPNLSAGNIGYQLLEYLGGMEALGPIIVGLDKPICSIPRGCSSTKVVHMTAIHAVMAQVEAQIF